MPRTWERVGISRVEPTTGPERSTEAGTEGATGVGEASWRRRLAPHHREAVRRYFGGEDGADDEGGEAGR